MASKVKIGNIFFSRDTRGIIVQDRIVDMHTHIQETTISNIIIGEHVIANDVVVSIRVDGDMPESLWNLGMKINKLFGAQTTHYYCRFGNWFRKTRMAALI